MTWYHWVKKLIRIVSNPILSNFLCYRKLLASTVCLRNFIFFLNNFPIELFRYNILVFGISLSLLSRYILLLKNFKILNFEGLFEVAELRSDDSLRRSKIFRGRSIFIIGFSLNSVLPYVVRKFNYIFWMLELENAYVLLYRKSTLFQTCSAQIAIANEILISVKALNSNT